MRALETDLDPDRSIALLDQYQARHPRGALQREATLTRIDALLALGDRTRALARLDAIDLVTMPRARELFVIRGELRGRFGRCADAVRDFSRALDTTSLDDLDARALFGRASCKAELHDDPGVRADLSAYLERHPRGNFARKAEAALHGTDER